MSCVVVPIASSRRGSSPPSCLDWLRSRPSHVKIKTTAAALVLVTLRLIYVMQRQQPQALNGGPVAFLQGKMGCEPVQDDRPIIFYHVPKTGGGTVRRMFLNLEKSGRISMCQQCVKLPQGGSSSCMETELSRFETSCGHIFRDNNPFQRTHPYSVIAGHYNFGIEYAWGGSTSNSSPLVTLDEPLLAWRIIQFRDPIDRMRSLYNFQTANDVLHVTFEDFIATYDAYNRDAIWEKFGGNRDAYNGLTIAIIRACGQVCIGRLSEGLLLPEGALELAKTNLLRHFAVVGITEEMDLFVEMCRRRFYRLRDLGRTTEDTDFGIHLADKEKKAEAEAMLTKPQIKTSLATSRALRLERELYEHAVQVMQAQWRDLQACNNVEQID